MWSFTADGAGVTLDRLAMSDLASDNVAEKLVQAGRRKMLVVHCSPHRLQLALKQSWLADYYLWEIDDNSHRHIIAPRIQSVPPTT